MRQEQALVRLWLGVASEDQLAAVGCGKVDIEHLHGAELVEGLSHGEARGALAQLILEGYLHAVGDEGHEDVRLDTSLLLMVDWPDGQLALQVFECRFDFDQLQIELPQLGGTRWR